MLYFMSFSVNAVLNWYNMAQANLLANWHILYYGTYKLFNLEHIVGYRVCI